MKYIRKKINLENFTIRSIPKSVLTTDSNGKTIIDTESPKYYYGTIPKYKIDNEGNFKLNIFGQKILNTIDINLYLTQKYDDMGLFTNKNFVQSNQTITSKPIGFNSFEYGRLAGAPISFYYSPPNTVSGYTDDSQLKQVKSYRKINNEDIYVPNLNTSDNPQKVFNGTLFEDSEKIKYKIGANSNNVANTGVEYTTFKNKYNKTTDEYGKNKSYNTTTFNVNNSGWNSFNTSLYANIKKEEYLGVVFKPEVESVVFISRGIADIFERHAILSEIKTTNDIDTNRGGFIRI